MRLPSIWGGVRRGLFVRLTVNAVGQSVLLMISAMLVRFAFDHLLGRPALERDTLLATGSALIAAALASGWLQYTERVTAEALGQSYVHSLRRRLFRHLTRMDTRQLQKRRQGAVMLRFIGDLNAIRRWVSLGLVRLIVSGAIVAGTLVVLWQVDAVLSVMAVAIIACGTAANIRVGRRLRLAALDVRKRRSRLSANISEKISQMTVVQVFGREASEIERVRRDSYRLRLSLVRRAGKIGLIRGINIGMTACMTAAVLTIGILRVNKGHTTTGTIAAAISVMGFLIPALRHLGRIFEYYQDAAVSRQKLVDFFSTPTLVRQAEARTDLAPGPGALAFQGVTVPGVLDNLSGVIAPGQKVALVGPNGAGKSTLLALAARMIDPQAGRVLIDGQDIAGCKLASVRQAVGTVGPDLPLLAGSLEMNLRYRHPDIPREEVERVRQLCGIDALIDDLPKGSRTRIHERGRNLSAGQRQRIALARALLGSPRILLLDEVDSHLDAEARRQLIEIIHAYPGTVVWATHLDAPFHHVDAVWRMGDGALTCRPMEPEPQVEVG